MFLRSLAACCLALAGVSAWAQAARAGVYPDHVVFGQSAKLSGTGGTQVGRKFRDGLLLAFTAANRAGGVHGRRLDLVSLDDEINADKAVANTRALIEEHHAFALIGHTFTAPVRAVLPMVQAAGIPFIAPYTGFDQLYDGTWRDVFVIRASFADELAVLVRHIDTVGYEQVALAYYANPLGEEFRRDVAQRLHSVGRGLVVVASMPLNAKDPAQAAEPAAVTLAARCPKVVLLGVSGRDAAALVRAIEDKGCPGVRYLARSLVDISLLMSELGAKARGMMVTQVVPNPFRGGHALVRDYREQLRLRDSVAPLDFAEFEGFVAGRLAVQALRRVGRGLDRPSFVSALESETLEGPDHYRVRFGPGKRVGSKYVNIVMIANDGRIAD